ncbi:exopolysaccharide production protein ExoZ [Burkholderia multivorans]
MHNHKKFDAFRGGAALVVALSHVCQIYFVRLIGWEHPAWIVARTLGWHAVIVFFLLSGYLITLSILKNSESAGGFDSKEFIAARIARIYPPFLASLLVVAVCMLALHALHLPGANSSFGLASDVYALPAMTAAPREILTSLAMIQGMTSANPPFWSLYLEVWAYVIAFFFALGFFGRQRRTRLAGLAAGVAALLAASIGKNNFGFFFAIWAFGAVICLLTHTGNRYRGAVLAVVGCVGCIVLATLALTNIRMVGAAFPVRSIELIAGAAFAGVYSFLIFGLRALDRPYPKWLVNAGGFSYTLYVVHFPILAVGLACTLPWIGTSLLRTALCSAIVFAIDVAFVRALAKFVERPKYFKALLLQPRRPLSGEQPRAAR